jgi:hypothetical protein
VPHFMALPAPKMTAGCSRQAPRRRKRLVGDASV